MSEILIVDDDPFLADTVRQVLAGQGMNASCVGTAKEALIAVTESVPSLMILDLSLPDGDGLDLCRRLRVKWTFPILMLTSRSDLVDKVIGLEVGADDYLTKPFEARELIARVRAALRRSEDYRAVKSTQEEVVIGPVRIDRRAHKVDVNGSPVKLTSLEFRLIDYFAQNSGRVLEREQLFETIWGYQEEFNSNSLDVFVYRLRTKLEELAGQKLIHTVRGVGYRFELE